MGTDWIDLYQVHRPRADTDIEETLSALSDLVQQGKVRYIGSSTFPASQIVEAQWAARDRHLQRFVTEQPRTRSWSIGPSDRFAAYLLKQIMVASGGRACAGSIEPPTDLAKTGVTIDYCPAGRTVTVAVQMLTDLNPAYHTLPAGPGRRTRGVRAGS